MKEIRIKDLMIGKGHPLTVISGPCVIENESMILQTAEKLKTMTQNSPVQLVFKSSFKKANRTSLSGFSGIEFTEALRILQKVREQLDIPLLTDIHTEVEAPVVAEVVDILQIPAFLCRQTDLLIAAGRTGKAVNIKKGQFLFPGDMANAAEKVADTGNDQILLTERGTTFGYHNLVVDMRGLMIMSRLGYPVVFDATHSVQLPGGDGVASGGQPEYILPLAKAALATGAVSAIFMEVHPDPPNALSDAKSQLALADFPSVMEQLIEIYSVSQKLEGK